ncbi:MAG: hydroxymethylbilane synthase [Solirubrobacteraceae bacterium]|jgi:hydroxymethylbilane synthase|nr:hydroxymethylbilane synthase [Solirubrobacteraceae bacterium]
MIRVGTRGSALALAQAHWVAERLGADAELVTITVAGDRGANVGDKSRWVSELERSLLDGEIDLAVHSAKDVPAELAPGLELVAIPARADPRDAICGAASLSALAPGARVGTSSLRRTAQIRAARSDLDLEPVRGNVDTRLRKLAAGEFDALVLALAGLQRLGREDEATGVLDDLVPAAGQGALALEARDGEAETGALAGALAGLRDPETEACVRAERELVRALGASCNTPVGAHARTVADGELELTAWIGLPDGSAYVRDQLRGAAGSDLGLAVAGRLTAVGARELLAAAEAQLT